ncbi:hypothetical protein [Ammoniphilus sp. YIM 78166]|uniref:hypothetical protein n=1 Tax=Ammoniphilus sp. YIM 78166 TaxID=1644106 RepID=UPI00106F4D24|nr:hypothetical protein [Ammoniphilus sp. YIM 78166]
MKWYPIFLYIHIYSAIICIGPLLCFPVLSYFLTNKGRLSQESYGLMKQLFPLAAIGAVLLLSSGFAMDVLVKGAYIRTIWMSVSAVLILLVVALIVFAYRPIYKKIGSLFGDGQLCPLQGIPLAIKLNQVSWTICSLVTAILVLMITKP